MQTPGDGGPVHVDACATCDGCEQCRWVATQAKATHVIEVKVTASSDRGALTR